MLSKEIIASIIPRNDLSDLTSTELENEINILLAWIKLSPTESLEEPSGRVKIAIHSVLKNESNQYHFTTLFINSINSHFNYSLIHNLIDSFEFLEIIDNLMKIKTFYDLLLKYLNLNSFCLNLFNKNLINKFKSIFENHIFHEKLYSFFNENFLQLVEMESVVVIIKFFKSIGLIDELNQVIIKIAINKIKSFITDNCQRVWSVPCVTKINNWIKVNLYPNLNLILKNLNPNLNFFDHLLKISYNELISLRINEIYDIVINYPTSEIALHELNKCLLFKLNIFSLNSFNQFNLHDNLNPEFWQRNKLVENFLSHCELYLLNSGVNTNNLIKNYIKIINSFLIIDPKGVLLDKAIRPIRRYLKVRDDIINKLVKGLLDPSPNNELIELSQELSNTENNLHKQKTMDDFNDLSWVPDPIDALPDFKKFKITDIIQSLISIFESKDIFITEFTKLFGSRLINLKNTSELKEILRAVNLLKLRFGKNEFFNLDIMIKDIITSHEFDNIKTRNEYGITLKFNSLILSQLYWQDILDDNEMDTFTIPERLNQGFLEFNETFKKDNYRRYLKLLPKYGTVKLLLEIEGTQKVFNVSPDKAAIIYLFNDHDNPIPISTVCDKLQMTQYLAKAGLSYWANEGIILEITPDNYVINE